MGGVIKSVIVKTISELKVLIIKVELRWHSFVVLFKVIFTSGRHDGKPKTGVVSSCKRLGAGRCGKGCHFFHVSDPLYGDPRTWIWGKVFGTWGFKRGFTQT